MKLHAVYARFYRSLNYDYLRSSSENYTPAPWDSTPDGDYPFVRIKLAENITTVVGANEAGKSQVLRAVQASLTGEGFEESDFCRYSKFFGIDHTMVIPEFGAEFRSLETDDLSALDPYLSRETIANGVQRFAVFRMNGSPENRLYVLGEKSWSEPIPVPPDFLSMLQAPHPFTIDADIPLPDSVPIDYLATKDPDAWGGSWSSKSLFDLMNSNSALFDSGETIQANATEIVQFLTSAKSQGDSDIAQYSRARDLLQVVAGVPRERFVQLQQAVRNKNGYATSIIDTVNDELGRALNFRHWWSQDSQFELVVDLYESDLVFMIKDRTGRSYGFDERSDGLKYFLSYFVQYLSHRPPSSGRPEILLMDEPDKFLSSSGQQDLLRIFRDFAEPKDSNRVPVQVVYVTHSPYLIDKNDASSIRVLEKGEHDEGTRVVNSSSANHYEPLRSAFGSFVAETTFIGNCNLLVEGASDQVLIAGASRWLRTQGIPDRDRIDLNTITIVPAGGTRHIPYLAYLARGRDVEKPPCVALLDNDKDGDNAIAEIERGGAYKKRLIAEHLVLQLGSGALQSLLTDNPRGVAGIEDIFPISLCLQAAAEYCSEFAPIVKIDAVTLDKDTIFSTPPLDKSRKPIKDYGSRNYGTLRHLESAICHQVGDNEFHLDKVGFARAMVKILHSLGSAVEDGTAGTVALQNLRILLQQLAKAQRAAERAEDVSRISSRINRAKRDFMRTHSERSRKEDVTTLIEEIESQLDSSPEADAVRVTLNSWSHTFTLEDEPRSEINDFPALLKAIDSVAYQAVRRSEKNS